MNLSGGSATENARTLICLIAALCAGCAKPPETAVVSGRVLLHGAPLPQIVVTFVPTREDGARYTSSAVTDAKGEFHLRCADGREGALVGPHRVLFEDLIPYSNPRNDRPSTNPTERATTRIPISYRAAVTTPLSHNVLSGEQTIDLVIEP